MDIGYSASARRLGLVSAVAVALLGLVYLALLGAGFASLAAADQPIGDPWFSRLELAIVVMMPALVTLMVAVHAWTAPEARALSLAALVFMSLVALLTTAVHFPILVLSRDPALAAQPWTPLLLSFRWPSLPYAIDILAWDLFFALSMLFAAPVFAGRGLEAAIRRLMVVSGLLALAGLAGAASGDMRLRNIGIVGYAVVFPAAAALLALLFHRKRPSA